MDFTDLLGSEWKANGIIKDDEDTIGWTDSIAGRSQIWTYNISDPLAFVKHHVIAYINSDSAKTRYLEQKTSLIHFLSTISPSDGHYEEINVSSAVNLRSDDTYVGCQEVVSVETKCVGLFLYDRHIVYVNAYLERNGVTYFSLADLENVFTLIDDKISTHN